MSNDELIEEHKRLTNVLKDGTLKERLEEYKRQMQELKELIEAKRRKHDTDMKKSNYGPKGAGLYDPTVNQKRKKNRTMDTVEAAGPNKNVHRYTSARFGTAQQQAIALAEQDKLRNKKQPVKTLKDLSLGEIKDLEAKYGSFKKDDSYFEAQVDDKGPWYRILDVRDISDMPDHPLYGVEKGNVYILENHPSGSLGIHQSRIKQREVEND